MEVEARFAIPDYDTMRRLRKIVKLGPFTPGEGGSRRVQDRYLDTPTRALYHSGYACRLRQQDDQRMVTIKGLGKEESAIHERFESELILPADAGVDPETWPEGEARDLVCALEDGPLNELFVVEQERHVRELYEGQRLVGELSVDEVRIKANERERTVRILEIELLADGRIEDLHALVAHLSDTWGLMAELHSKFHLGLALLDQPASTSGQTTDRLSATERSGLARVAEHAKDTRVRKRARLILGWAEGVSVQELVVQIDMSRSWVYEWLGRFRAERMDIFPADLLISGTSEPTLGPEPRATGQAFSTRTVPLRSGMTVAEMCERFQVDMAHARCVADHALALFDATASVHKLGPERHRLLEIIGILHNVGLDTDPARHHIAGRDIVQEHSIAELSEVQERMLATAVYLHRKRIKRKRLRAEVVTSLPPGIRGDALALAALLRIADGLDYSQGQTSVVERIVVAPGAIHVLVSGPFAEADVAQAQARADLWERLFDVPFFFAAQAATSLTQEAVPEVGVSGVEQTRPQIVDSAPQTELFELASPGMLADEQMSEAGRKVLRFHFLRMLKHEPGTRAGKDIEELHDMRVATRRMRAAFRVFAPYFKARTIRPYIAGLRRTTRALGAVRDLDVFMHKARAYLKTLPPERAHDLDLLFAVWKGQRERACAEMIDYLDGHKYQDFVQAFRLFLETPDAGVRKVKGFPPRPTLVCHIAPRLIYTRWAGVQAFGPLLDSASVAVLHALRIECKRLRYAVEFFREVLGPEVKKVIAEVIQLQDHLGNLNDADVANTMLSDFLFASPGTATSERVIAPGVVAYLAVKQLELQTLIDTFPQTWEQFNRPEVRRWLADTIAVL